MTIFDYTYDIPPGFVPQFSCNCVSMCFWIFGYKNCSNKSNEGFSQGIEILKGTRQVIEVARCTLCEKSITNEKRVVHVISEVLMQFYSITNYTNENSEK